VTDALWITEADVASLLSLPDAITALRAGLVDEARGAAANMVKTHASWAGGSTLHAIGAVFEGRGIVGTKTWSHTAGGAAPLLILFDAETGALVAIIEAFALGQMRTGGISGVAADILARPDARRMALIGAGKQSLTQIAAVAAVRELENIAVWSPTPAKREAFAARASDALGREVRAVDSLDAALDGADIVTLATRAREPFLKSAMLAPGTHINAVGAITPERAEFDPGLLNRCDLIAADSVPQVRRLSREFMDAFGDDDGAWDRLQPLSRLVAADTARPPHADLTLFKAMGMGISDVSLGIAILERARSAGIGRALPPIIRVAPRLASPSPEKVAR
jgi:ornithine cyclodeaminase